MGKALYRKYRPKTLAEVVGQEQVTQVLMSALKAGRVGHAYLFVGPRGTGKTSVARILAHEINGFEYQLEDDYTDIIEIDGASNRGIDNIRELREKVAIAPTAGKYKVYIIDEVHMLTKEAFNALLKTLEEPPAHVVFIMATTDAHKVPVTITSRAQTYTFRLAEPKVMQAHLRAIANKEKIKITDEALGLVVRRGGGSFRDSLSLLDQISTLSEGEISVEMVVAALGLPSDVKITTLLEAVSTPVSVVKITTLLRELLESGIKAETLAEELIRAILREPKPELLPLLAKLPEVKAPFAEARLLVALAGTGEPGTISSRAFATNGERVGDEPRNDGRKEASRERVVLGSPMADTPTVEQPSHQRPSSRDAGFADAAATPRPTLGQAEAAGASCKGVFRSAVARELAPAGRGLVQDAPAVLMPREENDPDDSVEGDGEQTNPGEKHTGVPGGVDWEEFVAKVRALNDAVATQLSKCQHSEGAGEVHLYPDKKITRTILSRANNKQILVEAAGQKVVIHEAGESPENAKKDALMAEISGIMGGEVKEDGGGNPF